MNETAFNHYKNHLADYYSDTVSDFEQGRSAFEEFCRSNSIIPGEGKIAIDFGAGHGIQSSVLAANGYEVTAVDFNDRLLGELVNNTRPYSVNAVRDDMCRFAKNSGLRPDLIVCAGDTLTHIDTVQIAIDFLRDCFNMLSRGGRIFLSFRDYTASPAGTKLVIPLGTKGNSASICVLDYDTDFVTVTDILHVKSGDKIEVRHSSYNKIRISADTLTKEASEHDFFVTASGTKNGMTYLLLEKK